MGALIVEARSRGIDLWATGLIQIALINFAFTFLGANIAVGAHLGGFAGGILVGVIYDQCDRRRLPRAVSLAAGTALGVAAFVASIAIAPRPVNERRRRALARRRRMSRSAGAV